MQPSSILLGLTAFAVVSLVAPIELFTPKVPRTVQTAPGSGGVVPGGEIRGRRHCSSDEPCSVSGDGSSASVSVFGSGGQASAGIDEFGSASESSSSGFGFGFGFGDDS